MLQSLVLVSGIAWIGLHVAVRWANRSANLDLNLPLASTPGRLSRSSSWSETVVLRKKETRLTIRDVRLTVITTRFNRVQDAAASYLRQGSIRNFVGHFYNLGTAVAIVTVLTSLFFLAFLALRLALPLMVHHTGSESLSRNSLARLKRDFSQPAVAPTPSPPLQLLIPGLTTPLFHLPAIIMALLICLIIHESGHAISAAFDFVPMSSAGLALYWIIPSAFVALSSASLENIPPWSRIRIASSGAWHNLVSWAILWLLGSSRLLPYAANALAWPLWENMDGHGRVVLHIDIDVPLHNVLPVGSIIETLNYEKVTTEERWNEVLSGKTNMSSAGGWCLSRLWLTEQAHDTACCLTAPAGSLSCFYQNDGLLNSSYCIDPLLIMDPSYTSPSSIYSDPERCYDTCTHSDFTCIHPRSDEQLMRISHAPFGVHVADREVLVWRGPVSEIWDHVEVGSFRPRTRIVPLYLPVLIKVFYGYLSVVSLSLFWVNLVPAPFLDGAEIFRSTLQWILINRASSPDLEAHFTPRRPVDPTRSRIVWIDRLETAAAWVATTLLLSVGLLSLVQSHNLLNTE